MTESAAALLLRDDRVLIMKRGDSAPWYPGAWDFPGGGVEDGESHREAARRECIEEAGFDPTLEDDPTLIYRHSNRRWRLHIFVGEATGPVQMNWEHTEHRWVSLDDLDQFEFIPGVKAALVAVL